MSEGWSPDQRRWLEALGYALYSPSPRSGEGGESPSSGPAGHLLHDVEKDVVLEAEKAVVPSPRSEEGGAPAPGEALYTPRLRQSLEKAAGLPFAELAQRCFLPPDLLENPHAKRAFWHVLKGLRRS